MYLDIYCLYMRLSESVEHAMHVVTVLAFIPDDEPGLTTAALAEFHGVGAPYLSKAMQSLVRAGICRSTPGRHGGFHLARKPAELTMLDVALAVEGNAPAFRCTEIRQRGPGAVDDPKAYPNPCGIASIFAEAESAWRSTLAKTTIEDLCTTLLTTEDERALAAGAEWITAVQIRRKGDG